jgi:5-(carboxyamino)imidazole ribonucleotide synthase
MKKLAILGGGQLGKMLCIAAAPLDITITILDENDSFPAAKLCQNFQSGSFKNFEDVYNVGNQSNVITIEIEHVNTDALHRLVAEGKTVHPAPDKLDLIKDKGRQKLFYVAHQLPTAAFSLFDDAEAVRKAVADGQIALPFVQKTRGEGYDGKGVAVVRNKEDLSKKLLEGACLVEDLVDIEKELAVIVCRNERGEIAIYDTVEMEFDPEANLVAFLFAPANVSNIIAAEAETLAQNIIEAFDICGLLAVEFFLTKDNRLLINEVAPRPHNSGHHTIDACATSQFQQHLRGVLNLPLGDTTLRSPAVMINLLGEPGHSGDVFYEGIEEALAISGVNIHLYGKKQTKPMRKMGHVTVLADTLDEAKKKAKIVQNILKVKTKG